MIETSNQNHGSILNRRQYVKEIVELVDGSVKTRDHQDRLPLHVAANIGLKWEDGMGDILHCHGEAIIEHDPVTSLTPLVLAAKNPDVGISLLYELIRYFPQHFIMPTYVD